MNVNTGCLIYNKHEKRGYAILWKWSFYFLDFSYIKKGRYFDPIHIYNDA